MKSKRSSFVLPRSASLGLLLAGCAFTLPLWGADVITLPWQESGLTALTGGMRPKTLPLSTSAPDGLKRAPANLAAPRYASLKLGPATAPATFLVILDEKDGKPARLYVDANANGDLTDDPACEWNLTPARDFDGDEATAYEATATLLIPSAAGPRRGVVHFFQVLSNSKSNNEVRKALSCYADYGRAGTVNLGGRAIAAALSDSGMTGEFRLDGSLIETPLFWLALTNGPAKHVGRAFAASRPFEVDGRWWTLTNLTGEGAFEIVASAKPPAAAKSAPRPDTVPLTGKKAPAFTGPLLAGNEVKFPNDYKGKVVLLDFWATWCGPCVAELPNVVAAYNKYHDQGFEVLGISLDKEGAGAKLVDFTKKKNMPWRQVYDGRHWNAAVAKLYSINAIPRMMLVDGDSGVVLADESLRGEALAPAIEKALAAKKK
jgi:peroxiredoxin